MKMNLHLVVLILDIIYRKERMGNTLDECQSKGTYWIALYVKNK